jgi:hypothetical protein
MMPYKPKSVPKWVGKAKTLESMLVMGSETTGGMIKPPRKNITGYQ